MRISDLSILSLETPLKAPFLLSRGYVGSPGTRHIDGFAEEIELWARKPVFGKVEGTKRHGQTAFSRDLC